MDLGYLFWRAPGNFVINMSSLYIFAGHFSWRNNVDGSWFVQALCQVFEQHGHSAELLQMMTLVNKIVAYDFESCTDDDFTSHMKQVPCVVSMLTRQFFFKPKY